ncbi:MAG: metallophosphoesterase [Kiritimatiellia bacterium]
MFFRVFFLTFPVVAWLIAYFVGIRPLKLTWRREVPLAGLLFLASQKFSLSWLLGGDVFNPEFPAWFMLLSGWAYAAFMLYAGWRGAVFVVNGLARMCLPKRRRAPAATGVVRRREFMHGLAAAGVAGWGLWEGCRVPPVRRTEIRVEGLPPAFDGFTILQLSDLHCSAAARREHVQAIVDLANTVAADIVCITGDLVDGSVAARREDLAPLKGLKARSGVFGCAGNHEYYSGYRAWKPVFESLGVQMLDNCHRVFERNGSRVVLGGITDEVVLAPKYAGDSPRPDIRAVYRGAPEGCRILLKHRPIQLPLHERYGVRLQLSGHTHGGICRGMDLLVAEMGNEGHLRGLYREGKIALHVSPGTGQWTGFPIRLGVPAEISELILRTPEHG